MANKVKWNNANFSWDAGTLVKSLADPSNNWNIVEIEEIVDSVTNRGYVDDYALQGLKDDKKKKLIRLIMHRNGIKIYDEKKEVKNITHHTKEIELIAEELKRYVHIIH